MTKNQRPVARSRRSSSYDRRLPRSRTNSVTSMDSSASHILDDNNFEMFSGAASEVIPSSITSLHYPHSFGNRRVSVVSRETSPLLSADENNIDLRSVSSSASRRSDETQSQFRFFSPDEIEMAQGGSTIENPEDPVDYNTDWEYSIDKFVGDEESLQAEAVFEDDYSGRMQSPEAPDYGSMNFERRNRRDSDASSDKSDLINENNDETNHIDKNFYQQFPAKLHSQRYYLAEEDIVVGIAGYRNCWWKRYLYYLLCVGTFGIGFLIMRWLPRYRVNFMGTKCPLGSADWCVIENEFGELQIINVRKQRFDERL